MQRLLIKDKGTPTSLHKKGTRQRPNDLQQRSQLRDECQQWCHIRGTQAPSSSSSSTTWWNSQHWEKARVATRSMARSAMVGEVAKCSRSEPLSLPSPPLFARVLHVRSLFRENTSPDAAHAFCSLRAMWHSCITCHVSSKASALAQGLNQVRMCVAC